MATAYAICGNPRKKAPIAHTIEAYQNQKHCGYTQRFILGRSTDATQPPVHILMTGHIL